MAHVGFYHRHTPWISTLDFFRGRVGPRCAHPGSIVGAGSLHKDRAGWHARDEESAAEDLGLVENTCAPYYEPGPIPLQSCANSSLPHAVPVPSDTVFILSLIHISEP